MSPSFFSMTAAVFDTNSNSRENLLYPFFRGREKIYHHWTMLDQSSREEQMCEIFEQTSMVTVEINSFLYRCEEEDPSS